MRLATDVQRSTARFDPTRRYRYSLIRTWDAGLPRACFCMLNPSTADVDRDDPTVAHCGRLARRWGCGSLEVVNIFALRATDPRRLYRARDPIGPETDTAILRAAQRAAIFVAAWGNHGELHGRGRHVLDLLARRAVALHCLAVTSKGHPRHPLYTPMTALPLPFSAI